MAIRYDPVIRAALLALMAYAIGLIPFYFLTPVHQSIANLLSPPAQISLAQAPMAVVSRPTVTRHGTKPKVGADTVSVPAPTADATAVSVPLPPTVTNDPRYAFLLLGYGGSGHDGAYLTDSMMVVIVNPDQKTLSLVSLPRDSWVPLSFGGGAETVYNKINTAYAFAQDDTSYPDRLPRYTGPPGPGNFASDTVSRLLGIPIRYYVGLDFSGFRQMIDAVGGIDVNVPTAFAARYPANDDPSIDASWTVVRFAAGVQHMSGERAIEYARARETIDNSDEGTDFARSRRQRLIIEAFKQRLYQPGGLVHLPQLLGIGAGHVDTNYAVPDAASLSQLALDWKDVTIYQTAISDQNYLEESTGPDGTYTLVPSSTNHDWAQIRAFVRRLWDDPRNESVVSQTPLVVENDTGVGGAATQVSGVLQSLGYAVQTPTDGQVRTTSRLVDGTSLHAADLLAPLLEADLGISSLAVVEDSSGQFGGVTLELGSDNLPAAKLSIQSDAAAPFSVVGIEKFGVWAPDVGGAPVVTSTPGPPVVASKSVTPIRTGSPSASATVTSGLRTPTVSTTPTRATSGIIATPVGTHPPATSTPTLAATRPAASPTKLPATKPPTATSAKPIAAPIPTPAPIGAQA